MTLLAELQRRNVIRMAGLYLVGAWLVVQVAGTLLPWFSVSESVLRGLVVLLVIGFVPALVFAWVFEMTPDGIKRDAEVAPEHSIAPQTARRMDRMIIAVLGLALVYFGVDKFVLAPQRDAAAASIATAASARPIVPVSVVDRKSIAVLAFTDLSPDQDQEYFSDGMAEEILNALVRIKDLKVAGRTSSFYYKGRNEDLRNIGKALAVAHVLEGSVRKQGNQVRITAQLIRSADGFHLWSKTYDGELSDVFKLQEQIARAIVDELQVVLDDDQKAQLVPVATSNPEAYALYLRATEVLNKRDYSNMPKAIGWLEQALALDPKFARGAAQLALLQAVGNIRDSRSRAETEKYARMAMALDPTLAQPAYVMGIVARDQQHFLDSLHWMERADALQPGDASLNMYYGQSLIVLGYTRKGVERLDRALAIDPMLPNALNWRAYQHLHAGDIDTAEAMFKRSDALGLSLAKTGLGEVARERRDFAAARSLLAVAGVLVPTSCLKTPQASYAEVIAGITGGSPTEQSRALAVIDECIAAHPDPFPAWVVVALMRLQQPARALELMSSRQVTDTAGMGFRTWGPLGAGMRRLPQFSAAAARMGWVDAWEKYGPPDRCRRLASRNYVCD